jgi:Tol biopolymer transport system component
MKMVTLKQGGWSRRAKAVWLVLFLVALSTMLGGCSNRNHSPVAVISATPMSGEVPLEVTLDASQSYDPDGDEISYKWDFGDGKLGKGQTLTHTFTSYGNHIVQLTVADTKEAKGVSSITIIVTLETASDTIGMSGGMVNTSQGSSVTVPASTLADGSVVSISELVEPVVKFQPAVEALGNGILITLLSSSINTIALKSQSLQERTPGMITIRVPLPSNMQVPSPDVIRGFFLQFTAGDKSTQMVVGMDREGDVAKVSIPVKLITEFAGGALSNTPHRGITSSVLCSLPGTIRAIASYGSYWFSRISVRMFAKRAGHIPPVLYRAESSSHFVPVGLIPSLNENHTSCVSQDSSIVPIILIHGYRILAADEVAITALSSGTSPGYEAYAQTSWNNFIDHFYEHCRADLKKKLPAGYNFKLYVYRWDTDEGFDKAGTGLARLISDCFGDRPFILIGHSAGGIVARACVEHNQALVNNFPGIITLASPHWGVPGASLFLDQSARDLEDVVGNSWLKELNENAKYTGKLITYGGFISLGDFITNPRHRDWKLEMGFLILEPASNDGVVPLYSALAEGYNVRERHDPYEDYDHGEMLNGKSGGSRLFKSICNDLQELAGELALPVMDSPPDDVDITVTSVNQLDLTVSSVNLSTASANPGDNLSVAFTVQNRGDPISGEFKNRVFLSTTRYGGQGGQRIALGTFRMSLDGSNSKTQTVNIFIPQVSAGTWYVAVYTDYNGIIDETDENNNINSAEIAIGKSEDHPPVLKIISPADGAEFTEGDPITFQSSAIDPEDGSLTGSALVWTSSIDGQVGTDESFTRSDLSVGTHTITLTATDSDGNSSSASINITVSSVGSVPPSPGPSEGKIAFVSNRDGRAEIYVMNADGSNVRRLTYTPGGLASQAPTWSPDGRKIAFISGGDWDGDGHIGLGLCVMDSDAGNVREIRLNINLPIGYINNLAWSPDGTRFAFVGPDPTHTNFDVYTMSIDGSDVRKLTTDSKSAWTPSWSPDSKYIAFSSTHDPTDLRDIYIMNADGSNQQWLSNAPPFSSEPAWSPDGTRLACQADYNDIWVMNSDGSNQIKLTNDPTGDYNCHPSWSRDGTTIAFVSNRDGNREIYIANVDGSGETRLTNDNANDWDPAWSPSLPTASNSSLKSEGKIAFASGRDSQGGIYVMNPDGSNVQRLSHGGQDPAWAPDGTRIAFTTAGAASLGAIYVMNSDGSNVRKLINEVHGIQGIAWSRNGAKIAFASSPSQLGSPEIYVMDADGTNMHNITNYWASDASPTWSPDGTKIAFESYRGGDYDIYVLDTDGGNLQRLTFAPYNVSAARDPAWSSDGNKIALSIGFNIFVMDTNGGNLRQLTNSGMDNSPTWSPDGTRIAFVSWRDGNQEIYVMNADGSHQDNITNNPAEDWDPAWSPALPTVSNSTLKSGGEELALPDFTVSSVKLSTSFTNPGDNVSVTLTVQNNGAPISGEFDNRVFLTPVTRYGVGQEIALGTFPMSLSGFNSKTQTVNIVIPRATGMGSWYVVVYTDCGETIDEANENNNTNSAKISIGVQGGPILPNEPPSVTIIFPQDGSSFAEGDVITFQGQATDPEGGALAGDTLLWYAEPVGDEPPSVLGTGESLSISWLPAGNYRVALTATDSGGNSSSASINMTVDNAGPTPPPPGPSEGKIAFRSYRDSGMEIYVMNPDGSSVQKLTNKPGRGITPAWSPDGTKIAFASDRYGNWDIYVMNPDGSNVQRLTNTPADESEPAWSPDGTKIAFRFDRDGNWDIYAMNADGSNVQRLTDNPDNDWHPAWSPDGTKIAFASDAFDRAGNWDIYVMNADGSNVQRLTDNPVDDWDPAWSPDGTKIAFASDHLAMDTDIFLMNADGSNQHNITQDPDRGDWEPTWSPDGKKIAFASERWGEFCEIYVMDADGSNQHTITDNPNDDCQPAWSPALPATTEGR